MNDTAFDDLKLVFIGPPGAGKSTAIRSVSDLPPVSTEVLHSDEKRTTTVAMDFGEIRLDDGEVVQLYGIPGQDRFEFIWPMVADSAVAAVFMLDARSPDPMAVLQGYLDSFAETVRDAACLLAITHSDQANPRLDPHACIRHLRARGVRMPVLEIDPREKRDVVYILDVLLELMQRANDKEAAHAA